MRWDIDDIKVKPPPPAEVFDINPRKQQPVPVIEAIGAAPSFGRDRRLSLAEMIEKSGLSEARLVKLAVAPSSDGRFDAVVAGLKAPKSPASSKTMITGEDGAPLVEARPGRHKLTLTLNTDHTKGFEDWLLQARPQVLRDWKSKQDG